MKDIFYMYSESWDLVGFNYKVYCVYENNIGGLQIFLECVSVF